MVPVISSTLRSFPSLFFFFLLLYFLGMPHKGKGTAVLGFEWWVGFGGLGRGLEIFWSSVWVQQGLVGIRLVYGRWWRVSWYEVKWQGELMDGREGNSEKKRGPPGDRSSTLIPIWCKEPRSIGEDQHLQWCDRVLRLEAKGNSMKTLKITHENTEDFLIIKIACVTSRTFPHK